MSQIESVLTRFKDNQRQHLLPILQEIQSEMGYLPEEAITLVGRHLNLPTSKVYAVATFYDQFRFSPSAKYHFMLCNGTACHMKESEVVLQEIEKCLNIKAGQSTRDKLFRLEVTPCVGACGQSPVLKINDVFYPGITSKSVVELIEAIKLKEGKL